MGAVILTMAGESARFAKAGISTPKWALRVGDRSILGRAIDSIGPYRQSGWKLVLVVREDHATTPAFAEAINDIEGYFRVVTLEATPQGQALSACAAASAVEMGDPLAVWCADTALLPGPDPIGLLGGNWITLADLPGEQWSFAEVDDEDYVVRTAEKRRISPHASVGLYGFRSMLTMQLATGESRINKEVFVAPLYNSLVHDGIPVRALHIPAERVVPLGTPAEVVASCARMGWSLPKEMQRA